MPVLRVPRLALAALFDESLTFLAGSLAWLALGVPLYLLLLLPLIVIAAPGAAWPFLAAAWLLLVLPSPSGLALAAQARTATHLSAPTFADFRAALTMRWRLGFALFLVGAAGVALLGANVWFYATVADGWTRLACIPWLYGLLFWIAMQSHLEPLVAHLPAPRLLDLYRRAALLTLGQSLFSAALALQVTIVAALCAALPPLLLLGPACLGLLRAFGFRELRRRLGDLSAEEALES